MTRKSKKGIVGKYPDVKNRGEVGPGIDFVKDNLTTGAEIEEAIKNKKRDF